MSPASSAEGFACIIRWLFKVWSCSITPGFTVALMSLVFFSGVCIVHVKTRSSILAANDPVSLLPDSLQYLHYSLLLLSPVYPYFSQKHFTSCSPLCCKTVCILIWTLCRAVSTHSEDVCETFTQQGYKLLQEAALGTNQAENPLIPAVTIRRGMLTWYATGWWLRWGGLVRRHSSLSWGFQP